METSERAVKREGSHPPTPLLMEKPKRVKTHASLEPARDGSHGHTAVLPADRITVTPPRSPVIASLRRLLAPLGGLV